MRQSSGALVVVAWPQTAVRRTGLWYDRFFALCGRGLGGGVYRLGHAGCLLISSRSSRAHYFDCGRYECPPQAARIRDERHDHELTLLTRARFTRDGTIANCEDLLTELAANDATHGDGVMVATILRGLDFDTAYRTAKELQSTLHPFRHFGFNSLNCTRFVLRMTRYADAPQIVRVLEWGSALLGPGTAFLVRAAASWGRIYVTHGGKMSTVSSCTAFFRNAPVVMPSTAQKRGKGSALPPDRDEHVDRKARWLSGTGAGKWIAVERDPGAPDKVRFRRWSAAGRLDCDRIFTAADSAELDFTRPFEIGYPTDCEQCTVVQDGRSVTFRGNCFMTY